MGYDRGDSFPFDFLNQINFYLVQNRKENCHNDHIPFNVKEIGNTSFLKRRVKAEVRSAFFLFPRITLKLVMNVLWVNDKAAKV